MHFEVALVDLVAAKLFADASARETAVPGAQLDAPAKFLEDALKIGSLDTAGEFGGDLRQRPAVIEFEMNGSSCRATICGGRFSGSITGPQVVTVACSSACSSSRTLPGQS